MNESSDNVSRAKADAAMMTIWKRWFRFYQAHFRGTGIAISAADQQAFYEIAQPILRAIVLNQDHAAFPGDIVEIDVPARSSTSKDGMRYRGRLVDR